MLHTLSLTGGARFTIRYCLFAVGQRPKCQTLAQQSLGALGKASFYTPRSVFGWPAADVQNPLGPLRRVHRWGSCKAFSIFPWHASSCMTRGISTSRLPESSRPSGLASFLLFGTVHPPTRPPMQGQRTCTGLYSLVCMPPACTCLSCAVTRRRPSQDAATADASACPQRRWWLQNWINQCEQGPWLLTREAAEHSLERRAGRLVLSESPELHHLRLTMGRGLAL